MKFKKIILFSIIAAFSKVAIADSAEVDAGIPEYKSAEGVSGKLNSVGSDTLAGLMALWTEEFKRIYPNVTIQVQAAGSSTAPPALTESASNLGPMSRQMKPKESAMFERRFGYKPTRITVALDALTVYIHKDNPLKGLTIPEVDAIFSSTRKCGEKNDIERWGDLGVKGQLKDKSLQLYGRNSVSGTYGYFKTVALCKGDYKSSVNEQPGSSSVVQSVASSLNAIGYSGIGYKSAGVKALPISKRPKRRYIPPTVRNVLTGKYPLTRSLYIYVNNEPGIGVEPVVKEFMKMVLSKNGQEIVLKDGYIPLTKRMIEKQLKRLD